MKIILLIISFLPVFAFSQQKLKKKYLGSYRGNVPAYRMQVGEQLINVDSASVIITIEADGVIEISIGQKKAKGIYQISFEGDTFVLLTAKMENQPAEERIRLYIKDKHLEREGIYPQPEAVLKKTKN